MSIIQLYSQLSPDKKQKLAERLRFPDFGSHAEIENALVSRYSEKTLKSRFASLSSDERVSLELLSIVSVEEQYPLHVQVAEQILKDLFKNNLKTDQLLVHLERLGFLFSLPYGWSEIIVIPEEVQRYVASQAFTDFIARQASVERSTTNEHEVQTVENNGLSLYHDILTLTSVFARDVIPVTQKGHVYKRTLKVLLANLRTTEHRFPDTFGEPLPRNYHFLEAFLKYHKIVSFEHKHAIVNQSALDQLLGAPYVAWAELIYQFFIHRVYAGRFFPRSFLVNVITRLGREGWVSADDLFLQLEQQWAAWGMTITRSQLNSIGYHPFTLLGLIEWGQDVTGNDYWRWTNWGQAFLARSELGGQLSDELYVQPNLEIIVPEQVLPAIRWSVEAFAELQQADTAFIYKLTRDRLLLALEAGWSITEIDDFLRSFSKIPVADNILPTLQGWVGNYGQAVIWDVMVLKVGDERIAAQLKKDRGFAKWIVTSFSEDTFVIDRKDEPYVRAWLEDLGITVPLKVHGTVKSAREDVVSGKLSWVEEEKKRKQDAWLLVNLSALAPVEPAYFDKSSVAKVTRIERERFAE